MKKIIFILLATIVLQACGESTFKPSNSDANIFPKPKADCGGKACI